MSDRFESMDLAAANTQCKPKPPEEMIFDNCGRCKLRVGLHCEECKIQVTGCLCTEVDRFGKDEAWLRAVDRFGEELARERMKEAGFWVPGPGEIH